jgi:hypothetical protein
LPCSVVRRSFVKQAKLEESGEEEPRKGKPPKAAKHGPFLGTIMAMVATLPMYLIVSLPRSVNSVAFQLFPPNVLLEKRKMDWKISLKMAR